MSTIKWSEVVKKAWKDPEFKNFLLDNPREAIQKVTNTELPDDFEFFVHEQTNNQVHLVLPLPETDYATKASSGDGDEKAVFLEPDDAGDSDKKAVFLEPDDAGDGDEKAVFLEPDDAGNGDEKAVFLEPDDSDS